MLNPGGVQPRAPAADLTVGGGGDAFVEVNEGEIKTSRTGIRFPNIDSCLGIAVALEGGEIVGAHFVEPGYEAEGYHVSERMVADFDRIIAGKKVESVSFFGETGGSGWDTARFTGAGGEQPALALFMAKVFGTTQVYSADRRGYFEISHDSAFGDGSLKFSRYENRAAFSTRRADRDFKPDDLSEHIDEEDLDKLNIVAITQPVAARDEDVTTGDVASRLFSDPSRLARGDSSGSIAVLVGPDKLRDE